MTGYDHRCKHGVTLSGLTFWGIACLVIPIIGFWPSYVAPINLEIITFSAYQKGGIHENTKFLLLLSDFFA